MSERRLSDVELAGAEQQLAWRTQGSISIATRDTARRAIAELRALRLTDADREALEWLVRHWGGYLGPMVMNDPAYRQKHAALSVLSKLLGQGGESHD